MTILRAPVLIFMATAVVGLMAAASSALELTAESCSDLQALPTTMTEDTTLILEENTDQYDGVPQANVFVYCLTELTTVHVDGPYKFVITTNLEGTIGYNFYGVRFEVTGGADLTFDLDLGVSIAGAQSQGSDGGAIYVESGSSLTFDVLNGATIQANSVEGGYSGGALYAGGDVEFKHFVQFVNNAAGSSGGSAAGNGGGVAVGPDGSVNFLGRTEFVGNDAHSGGIGGGLANSGSVYFGKRGTFYNNMAIEDASGEGGYGGGVYTAYGATTEIEGRTIWYGNEAASGGALYNMGNVYLNSNGFFRLNKATGSRGEGGHIYNEGYNLNGDGVNYAEGFIDFGGGYYNMREGQANIGGAFYNGAGGSFGQGGDLNYLDNTASEYCDNRAAYRISGTPQCYD